MLKDYLKVLGVILLIGIFLSGGMIYNTEVGAMSDEPSAEQSQDSESEENKDEYGLEVGKLAPNFTLTNLAGEEKSLTDYRGQYVLLNFWAAWCSPCRAEMPDLDEFHQKNQEQFIVLGVNLGDAREKVSQFMSENGYDYPTLLDTKTRIKSMYNIYAIPTSYFLDPQGRIQYIKRGLVTAEELEEIKQQVMQK